MKVPLLLLLWIYYPACCYECTVTQLNEDHYVLNSASKGVNGIHLNEHLVGPYSSSAYFRRKINVVQPWRIQFQYILNCAGDDQVHYYPEAIGDGFTVIIQNEPQGVGFKGGQGNSCGYCFSNSCGTNSSFVIMFNFYQQGGYPFIKLTKASFSPQYSMVNAVPPDPKWSTLNAKTCGIMYDTIVNFNGTHLTLFMDSPQPWFSYQVNMTDLLSNLTAYNNSAFIGWTSSSGKSKIDVFINNVVLFENCDSPVVLRTENCTSVKSDTSFNTSLFTPSSPSSLNTNITESSIDLNPYSTTSIAASVFFKEKIDITAPFSISFQVTPFGCLGQCIGNGFTFLLQDSYSRLNFLGKNTAEAGLGYTTESNYAGIAFNNNGYCLQQTPFIYLFSSNTADITGSPTSNATGLMLCNTTYPISIDYNQTTLSVYYEGIQYITYRVSWTNLLLIEANRYAYIGWTMSTSPSSSMGLRIQNIRISRYTSTCFPSPLPVPTPPTVSPESFNINVKSDISYLGSLKGHGNITLTNGSLHIRGSLNFTGSLIFNALGLTVIAEGLIDLSQCTVIINLYKQPPLNEGILLISTNDIFYGYPNITFNNVPQWLSYSTSYGNGAISVTFNLSDAAGHEHFISTVIGTVFGVFCLILIILGMAWWRKRKFHLAKALDDLNVNPIFAASKHY